jgi:17beta-estradiol 17-dehydrogenase / very-long-chain 3-oxoacyl-CoA reductase
VNNVGKSHAMPAYLVDTPLDEIADIVTINVKATVQVTYAVLPGMVQRCADYSGRRARLTSR